MTLFGETQEEDRRLISDCVIQKMNTFARASLKYEKHYKVFIKNFLLIKTFSQQTIINNFATGESNCKKIISRINESVCKQSIC